MKKEEIEKLKLFDDLPSAIHSYSSILQTIMNKKPVLFLDYDGTLTPIVKDPDKAYLSEEMRGILKKLANRTQVCMVSGRAMQTVKDFVQLEEVVYAGSHGFNITGPGNMHMEPKGGKNAMESLNEVEIILNNRIGSIENVYIERKKYAIAIHYRNIKNEDDVAEVKEQVEKIVDEFNNLKWDSGRKLLEVKPNINWHKGKAITWLLEKLDLDSGEYVPFFIGDDVTDEDGFRELKNKGITIKVNAHGKKTHADYRLENVEEVKTFLDTLKDFIGSDERHFVLEKVKNIAATF
jgi:trehalose-phosphatase